MLYYNPFVFIDTQHLSNFLFNNTHHWFSPNIFLDGSHGATPSSFCNPAVTAGRMEKDRFRERGVIPVCSNSLTSLLICYLCAGRAKLQRNKI